MGIKDGEMVRVSSARGHIEGKAMLTKRIRPMTIAGKKVYQIGFPIHWGFIGRGKQGGSLANITTPPVLDPNSFCPEYQGFLVKLEKVSADEPIDQRTGRAGERRVGLAPS